MDGHAQRVPITGGKPDQTAATPTPSQGMIVHRAAPRRTCARGQNYRHLLGSCYLPSTVRPTRETDENHTRSVGRDLRTDTGVPTGRRRSDHWPRQRIRALSCPLAVRAHRPLPADTAPRGSTACLHGFGCGDRATTHLTGRNLGRGATRTSSATTTAAVSRTAVTPTTDGTARGGTALPVVGARGAAWSVSRETW